MGEECARYRRPLKFVPGVEKVVRALPADVQDVFGKALMAAQYGDQVSGARPFGEGVPRDVLKLVEDDDGETYRAAFVVAFAGVVYLLDVFQKKSKSGSDYPNGAMTMPTTRKATTGAIREKNSAVPTAHGGEPEAITFSPMHDNFFEAMGLPDAAERLAKAEMALAISHVVKAKEWNQKHTAEVLGVAASDVSDLLRGKLARFSQERLGRFLNALDMDVVIQIGPRPTWKSHASITVKHVAQFSRAS